MAQREIAIFPEDHHIALLDAPGLFAWATGPADGGPLTALCRLIQGIWEGHPDQALTHLRGRLHTDAPEGPADRGLVRVTARRVAFGVRRLDLCERIQERGIPPLSPSPPPLSLPLPTVGSPLTMLDQLEGTLPTYDADLPRWSRDRPIVALLLDPQGQPLWASRNRAARDRTRHAEAELARGLWMSRSRIPRGATLLCSLSPCRMCAGAILACLPDNPRLSVRYRVFDPGPMAAQTALEGVSGVDLQILGQSGSAR
jgi:hypothetical protein